MKENVAKNLLEGLAILAGAILLLNIANLILGG